MKVEIREKRIPARIIEEKLFIAVDGKEFSNEYACLRWEHYLELQEQHVFKTCVKDVFTLEDESAILYNIRNNEDHKILMSTFSERQLYDFDDEYSKYGPGWYIFFTVDGGDGYDSYYLWYYDAYVKQKENELVNWKNKIESKMAVALS